MKPSLYTVLDATTDGMRIQIEVQHKANYSLILADIPLIRTIRIKSLAGAVLRDARVDIRLNPLAGNPAATTLRVEGEILPGADITLDGNQVMSALSDPLANASELTRATLTVEVSTSEGLCANITASIEIEPYNEFRNVQGLYAAFATFVQPNARALTAVLQAASTLLGKKTSDTSLQGYQAGPNRAHQIAGAIYESLHGYGLSYINPPASFENSGQKVRTTEQVLDVRMGTCIDLAVMYAAALEASGLHPILFLTRTHAFAGFYADEHYGEFAVISDPNVIANIVGTELVVPVEMTMIGRSGRAGGFTAAKKAGSEVFRMELDQLTGLVDVTKARLDGIRPMPLTNETTVVDGEFDRPFVAKSTLANLSLRENDVEARELKVRVDNAPPRFRAWKRDLLDLSLRNPLLNLPSTRRVVNMLIPDGMLELLDDTAHRGQSIQLRAGDELTEMVNARGVQFASELNSKVLTLEFKTARALYTLAPGERVRNSLRQLRRESELLTQETGSNYLYLTFGALVHTKPNGGEARAPLFLLPVRLKGGYGGLPYSIQMDGDEPAIPNLCLLQWLAVTKGIEIPELVAPPRDDSGIAMNQVLDAVRTRLLDAKIPFRVEESSALAILKFSTFQIWRDLDLNWEHFMRNPVVEHLVNRPGEDFIDPVNVDDQIVNERELRLPIPADGSQLRAIARANAGQSFVLEGPPGTGKSQTIANLIAHSLANRRKVLFVAEKQAALEVVARRLDAVGVGDFCLDLHGSHESMTSIRRQLKNALDVNTIAEPTQWRAADSRMAASLTQMESYPPRVHATNGAGHSLWSAYDAMRSLGEGPAVSVPTTFLNKTMPRESDNGEAATVRLADLRDAAERLQDAALQLNLRPRHPWLVIGISNRQSFDAAAMRYSVGELRQVAPIVSSISATAREVLKSLPPGRALDSFLSLASNRNEATMPLVGDAAYIRSPQWESLVSQLEQQLSVFQATHQTVLSSVTVEGFTQDLTSWYQRAEQADARWFLRGRRRRGVLEEMATAIIGEIPAESLTAFLGAWILAQRQAGELLSSTAIAGLRLPFGWQPWHPEALEALRSAHDVARIGEWANRVPGRLELAGSLTSNDDSAMRSIAWAWAGWIRCCGITSRSMQWWDAEGDWAKAWLEDLPRWEESLTAGGDLAAQRMADLLAFTEPLDALGFTAGVDEIMVGAVPPDQITLAIERGLAVTSISERVAASELSDFDPERHDREVKQYLSAAEAIRKIASSRVPAQIQGLRPFDQGKLRGEVAELKRQLDRKRGGLSFRELVRRFPGALTSLTPCFLMSPGSVAHFLDAASINFDLVIFDEASQIRVPQSIGAMGRAKAVVVVGDSKQMPPTRVMEVSVDREGRGAHNEEIVVADLESILSESVESGLPREWLAWHYRSRSESLIAFSNERYYDSRLVTLPEPQLQAEPSVSWRRIHGHFERGGSRTNLDEAQAIVDEIAARLAAPETGGQSIGVVTFNIQQRDLIATMLEDSSDLLIRQALELGSDDRIFVKNLENVQGDERDTILFSLAFSPDPETHVLPLNFGPLNIDGGERRLNVAVTRARTSIVVFSSFDPAHIDLARTSSQGVHDLRRYLEYATQASTREVIPDNERSRFGDEIEVALTERGMVVERGLGMSAFTVDLAVRQPESKSWQLAIMVDSPAWNSRPTVVDREGAPQLLHTIMGWPRIYRAWLPGWLRDQSGMVDRIVAAVESEAAKPEDAVEVVRDATPDVELIVDSQTIRERRESPLETVTPVLATRVVEQRSVGAFRTASTNSRFPQSALGSASAARRHVAQIADAALSAEGPMEIGRLTDVIARVSSHSRLGSAKRNLVHDILRETHLVTDHGGTFVWPSQISPESWRGIRRNLNVADRSFGEVSICEISNAMNQVVVEALSASREDLYRETIEMLGFARLTEGVRDRLKMGLENAVLNGTVTEREGRYYPGAR